MIRLTFHIHSAFIIMRSITAHKHVGLRLSRPTYLWAVIERCTYNPLTGL